MNGKCSRKLVVIVLLIGLLASLNIAAVPARPLLPVLMNFTATLQPGVWHGWVVSPSSSAGGYLVEVSPLNPSLDGGFVERALVQPEFDGSMWNDVLRVQIPDWMPALKANIRVYGTDRLPVVSEFDTALEPGVWHGFIIAPSQIDTAYIAEVTPLDAAENGAFVEKVAIEPEFSDVWYDVLRVQIPGWMEAPLKAHIRIYAAAGLPVVSEFETTVYPGDWQGQFIQPSRARQGLLAEITPLDAEDGWIDRIVIQPEYNGSVWNDILRLSAPEVSEASLRVKIRVYGTGVYGKPLR